MCLNLRLNLNVKPKNWNLKFKIWNLIFKIKIYILLKFKKWNIIYLKMKKYKRKCKWKTIKNKY